MSSPNQNKERPENVPVGAVQAPEVPADDNVPGVPLQSPDVQVVEPVNANVQIDPEVQVNANLPVPLPVPEIHVVAPADGNAPAVPPLCEAQNESSSGSSEGSFEEYLPHMVRMNLSLTSSSPATSSTKGSSNTPTVSTNTPTEERSSLTGTPSSEGSVETTEATALTSEQMITEIVNRLPDSSRESAQKSKMDVDSRSPKETPKGAAGDAKEQKPIKLSQVKAALSKIPRLPPLQKPAGLPVVKSPIPQQRATSLPPIPGAVVTTPAPQLRSSVAVLPPVTGATAGPSETSRGLTKDSSDSSLSTSTSESVESDSPKMPTRSAVDVAKRRDSSDGSKADESSNSGYSPLPHHHKRFHRTKELPKSTTWTDLTPVPVMSRADTLDDVQTIKTDSVSFQSTSGQFVRPLSPERDRRAISLPADPPNKDPAMAPQERRAYSEAKAQEMEVVPAPPPQSLDTSVSWPSSDPVDLPSEVKSEPVKRVTEKVQPALQAISEGHSPLPPEDQPSSVSSPRVPEIWMADDLSSDVVAYAGDRSFSNSDLDPKRERPRREDREADRQVREFKEALAEAEQASSGLGTDSDAPLSTLSSTSENRRVLAGYKGWLQPGDDGSLSLSSSDPSNSDGQNFQMMQGWLNPGSQDQSGAGPSGVGKTSQGGRDTLSVISEKGESLSPSSVSGSLSPSEMEGIEDLPKSHGSSQVADDLQQEPKSSEDVVMVEPEKDPKSHGSSQVADYQQQEPKSRDDIVVVKPEKDPKSHGSSQVADDQHQEPKSSDDVVMVEPEKDPKSRLVVNLKGDGSPRTPKRKREPKKSTDDSPKDPELLSPGEDSKKKYCSEFNRPVMAGQIARSSSTGSVKPEQVQNVDIESFKKLADKKRKSPIPGAEEPKRDPKDKSEKKDPEDKREQSA